MQSMRLVFRPTLLLTKSTKTKIQKFSLDRSANFETQASPRVVVEALHVEESDARRDAFDLLASLKSSHG